jgi:ABC-type glycerol-3-phosphate transport system permease component
VTTRRAASSTAVRVAVYLVLGVFAFLLAFPYYWMVVTTLRDSTAVYSRHINLLPLPFSLEAYRKLLTDQAMSITTYFMNSAILSVGATLLCVVTALLASYPLARRRMVGRRLFFYLIIATMMVPGEVVLVGMFLVVNSLHLINTYLGMILPLSVNAVVFFIFYNFMRALPRDLENAARIDGASELQVLLRIVLPLSGPAVNAGAVLVFLAAWQNFTVPYILAASDKMYPLAVGVLFQESTLYARTQEILTFSTILTIPTLVVFALTQRIVFSALTAGGVKE